MILGEASWLTVTGIGAGLGAALLLTRFDGSILFGLESQPPTYTGKRSAVAFYRCDVGGVRYCRALQRRSRELRRQGSLGR